MLLIKKSDRVGEVYKKFLRKSSLIAGVLFLISVLFPPVSKGFMNVRGANPMMPDGYRFLIDCAYVYKDRGYYIRWEILTLEWIAIFVGLGLYVLWWWPTKITALKDDTASHRKNFEYATPSKKVESSDKKDTGNNLASVIFVILIVAAIAAAFIAYGQYGVRS